MNNILRTKHKGGIASLIVMMVILTVFASGAIVVYTIFMKPENKSVVPSFRNRLLVDAVAEAEKLGLVVQVEPVASTLPEGRVLAQSPESGAELRKGQVILLQVSRGGELHAVPDVRGRNLSQAQADIKAGGFSLGDVIRIREGNSPAGTVIAQSPAAPASIASGRKIDLLVQDGSNSDGTITIPDVNRMTESEARSILNASGIKIQAVNRVYSPLLPEGLAIETQPSAGTSLQAGQGVTLKLATQKRPAGYIDADKSSSTTSAGTVRRVTSNQTAETPSSTPKPSTTAQSQTQQGRGVTVSVKGQDDVFIGDDYSTAPKASTPAQTTTTPSRPAASTTPAQTTTPAASSSGRNKTARIRYVVPPIARPMNLRIEVTDPSGKRDVLNRQVRSGESINTTAAYTQECVISIYLGGEFVWQEKQR